MTNAYEIEYRDIDKGTAWGRYRSTHCKPFKTEALAREFVRSAEIACTRDSVPFVFRIIPVTA